MDRTSYHKTTSQSHRHKQHPHTEVAAATKKALVAAPHSDKLQEKKSDRTSYHKPTSQSHRHKQHPHTKATGAAEKALIPVSHSHKLQEKRSGKYVDNAVDYHRRYHSDYSKATTTRSDHSTTTTITTVSITIDTYASSRSRGGAGKSGSRHVEDVKMAEGFSKKR